MVASLPVFAYSVVGCPEAHALHAIRDELAQATGIGMVNVFADKVFGGWTLDSAPGGVNKWSGVEAFCRYRGIDPTAVLAIGDGDNDVELLQRAARSCAMSHGTEKAKATAQVTLTGGLDGWGQLLDPSVSHARACRSRRRGSGGTVQHLDPAGQVDRVVPDALIEAGQEGDLRPDGGRHRS